MSIGICDGEIPERMSLEEFIELNSVDDNTMLDTILPAGSVVKLKV